MAEIRTIIGIKKATTKDGKPCKTYYFTEEYSDYDLKNGHCEGVKVGSEYSQNVFDTELKVGDKCKMYHEVINGKNGQFAVLSDIVKIESAGNNKK